ncbi:MAG TPA: hypothetical protein VHC22_33915 [Pirellulales bacterium]|nr:hypothetical protein [Pirellulales bacterium]
MTTEEPDGEQENQSFDRLVAAAAHEADKANEVIRLAFEGFHASQPDDIGRIKAEIEANLPTALRRRRVKRLIDGITGPGEQGWLQVAAAAMKFRANLRGDTPTEADLIAEVERNQMLFRQGMDQGGVCSN